jgi:hypothetical protein
MRRWLGVATDGGDCRESVRGMASIFLRCYRPAAVFTVAKAEPTS